MNNIRIDTVRWKFTMAVAVDESECCELSTTDLYRYTRIYDSYIELYTWFFGIHILHMEFIEHSLLLLPSSLLLIGFFF